MKRMRKVQMVVAAALCAILLVGCAGRTEGEGNSGEALVTSQGTGNTGSTGDIGSTGTAGSTENAGGTEPAGSTAGGGEYMDIQVDSKRIFEQKQSGWLLCMQYYQGEPVQIWADKDSKEAEAKPNVYLNRQDGSSELLIEGLSDAGTGGEWFLAQDGSLYHINTDYENNYSTVVKYGASGEVVYDKRQDMKITHICQLADGKLILLMSDGGGLNGTARIGELNPDTGTVASMDQIKLGTFANYYIGAGTEGLIVMDPREEVQEVNVKDGSQTSLMTLANASYDMSSFDHGMIVALRALENGGLEILRTRGTQYYAETVRMQSVDKRTVVIRGYHFNNSWVKDRIAEFNRTNDNYHIVMEVPQENDWEGFATQTSIQMATGKGPDLLYGEVLNDYIQGMIEKGGFVDLSPYMAEDGIREEDYFPSAFSSWRDGDKIYGISVVMNTYRYSLDASVLGEKVVPDIETLVDALLARKEKAAYMRYCDSPELLRMFLEGSEDLWGMIDWEKGTCDFSGGLFAKLLEAAKRYPHDENQDYPVLADNVMCDSLYNFDAPSIQEGKGTVTAGVMFDDGCYPAINSAYQILAINANSSQKQGAWEFIRFLLGEDSQMTFAMGGETPMSRKAFEVMIENRLEDLAAQKVVKMGIAYRVQGKFVEERWELHDGDITEEWIEAFTKAAEDARPLPIRTAPILDIICEDAQDYFNGVKGIEDVIGIIRNRVQLYMDENG